MTQPKDEVTRAWEAYYRAHPNEPMWPFPEPAPEPPKTPRWKVWLARVMGL